MKIEGNVTEIFNGMGFAIAICGLCIGVGSCNYLEHKGIAKVVEAKANAQLTQANAKLLDAKAQALISPEKIIEKEINK